MSTRKEIMQAGYEGDIPLLRQLLAAGANLNEIEPGKDSLLKEIVSDLCNDEKPFRYDVVRALLGAGADPNILGEERSSPMTPAMIHMDTEMLRLLLDAGADPNKAGGFSPEESFYDWAEFDYRYNVYDLHLPEEPTEDDQRDENAWLRFLDRIAEKHGVRHPDHLFLLRDRGARTMQEIKKAK